MKNPMQFYRLLFTCLMFLTATDQSLAEAVIAEIRIEGNAKVESAAIKNLLSSQKGDSIDPSEIRQDIQAIYDLGYFSDVAVYKEANGNQTILIYAVKEKPAITKISFSGLSEVSEDDIKKQLETKLYTIVNDGVIAHDIGVIEKKYEEKGYHLAKVTYELKPISKNEVELVYRVEEGGKILVGDVHILGNEFFTENQIIEKLAVQPYTRSAAYSSSSIFQTDRLNFSNEALAFLYRDFGFAEVQVSKPITSIDADRKFVRITMQVEEGLQYSVGEISLSGDVGEDYYPIDALTEAMKLKPDELFRHTNFTKDIEMLVDKYGDLGYAFVDVNPRTKLNREKRLVDINYEITKGKKVYFGLIDIIGNTKTRDNVARREMEIADGELYSGTRLSKSKRNINRLGYFEEVQVLRERDETQDDVMNLKVKVKEKPTGQLQAAIGYSPSGETAASGFGQGRYEERNQSGRGWTTNLTMKYSSATNYQIDTGFANPRVYDSYWSLGLNYSYEMQETRYGYASGIEIPEQRQNISVTVGRKIIELIRGSVTLRHSRIRQEEEIYIFDGLQSGGIKNTLYLGVSRKDLNNLIDPTEGTSFFAKQAFTGGVLGGDYQFMESSLDLEWFIPIDFTEEYRTYFKVHGFLGQLSSFAGSDIPPSERYRLGGYGNLRGFGLWSLGPKERRGRSPGGSVYDYNRGGDKQTYFQWEYFLPLIPQAGIKFVLFADGGRVYNEDENLDFSDFDYDIGFGFRWITPIAPFRFEWAAPYDRESKSFGELKFNFNIGY